MKVDREKLRLAMARACMNSKDLAEAGDMPRGTLDNAIKGLEVSPRTAGIIARALGVDVTEIIEEG